MQNKFMPRTHRAFWIGPLIIAALLAGMSAVVRRTRLRHIYDARMAETPRERLFLASVGFFTAVLVVRGITIAIHNSIGPFHDSSMGGRHIHHFVWGILLLPISGYGWLQWVGRLRSMWARAVVVRMPADFKQIPPVE
jgi:hypothetical protein